jgi:anti-anti-sigma regulatory factor
VAFSLFNKKGSEPQRPHGPAGHGRPAESKRQRPAEPPLQPATPPAPKSDPRAEALDMPVGEGDRKSSRLVVEHGFQGSGKGRGAARESAAREPAAESPARAAKRGPDSVMMMEIQESPFEVAPMLEEAAILYANRQEPAAQQALEEAIALTDIPQAASRQAWMMLFDLLENQGRRADFEAAALAFAVRFETSPPAFNDRSEVKAAQKAANVPQVVVGPRLDASAARQMEQLRSLAAKHRQLGVELKVETFDESGCMALRGALEKLRKSGHELALNGSEALADMLLASTQVGDAEVPQAYWLLLLDLYQAMGRQAEFEDTALNYCVTYEVSPPSWIEAPRKAPSTPVPEPTPEATDAFYLKGEIEGNHAVFKEVGDFAAAQDPVVIDVYSLKRMDFIAAGTLLNLVAALKTAGKQVDIRAPSPLIATLLVTMGFTAYARLVRRKAPGS